MIHGFCSFPDLMIKGIRALFRDDRFFVGLPIESWIPVFADTKSEWINRDSEYEIQYKGYDYETQERRINFCTFKESAKKILHHERLSDRIIK